MSSSSKKNHKIDIKLADNLSELLQQPDSTSLVGAIDQGTSSTRLCIVHQTGSIIASAQMEHTQIYSDQHVGWHEHDPMELWKNTQQLVQALTPTFNDKYRTKLSAIGITNQRETTVCWNRKTGKPYYNAIVWDDTRTVEIAHSLTKNHDHNQYAVQRETGLPFASYFAGTKVSWMLRHVPNLRRAFMDSHERSDICFGTIDTWLLYQLTATSQVDGYNIGGIFCTDVTNASRWLWVHLDRPQEWDASLIQQLLINQDPELCDFPIDTALPKICPSSHRFGKVSALHQCGDWVTDVPLAGVVGDQQAALFGQAAFRPGQAKNTYGTGLFLMMNTGTQKVLSSHGLLTTVAYQLADQPVHYALEGSVAHSGSVMQWLRDQLGLISSAAESETLATSSNGGMYLVPAFSGLFAPYWRDDARACMVGMTSTHHKGHVCRAALEAAAYQTKEIFDAISADYKLTHLSSLKVDGGGTHNNLLMQFQSDILNVDVVKPQNQETTAMGAAFCAGLATGVWKDIDEIQKLWAVAKVYKPNMSEEEREKNWKGWKKAVTKSFGWEEDEDDDDDIYVDALEEVGGGERHDMIRPRLVSMVSMAVFAGIALSVGYSLGRSSVRGKR